MLPLHNCHNRTAQVRIMLVDDHLLINPRWTAVTCVTCQHRSTSFLSSVIIPYKSFKMALSVDQRTQILIEYLKTPNPIISKIARMVKCCPKTVRNIVKQWNERKTIVYKTSPGTGQKVEQTDLDVLFAYAATPEGRTKTLKQLKSMFPLVKYSIPHISRLLVKKGLPCFVQKKKPLLEDRHIRARLAFALANQHRNWNQVVFSDEKTVYSGFNGRKLVRRERGKHDPSEFVPTKASKVKVNLWGFISPKCSGLYLLPNKANGDDYYNLIQATFLPTIREQMDEIVFMQDGASIHNSAKSFLEEEKVPYLDWPARSPDLNPIENIWGIMQKLVNKWYLVKGTPTNRTQLFSLCKKAFKRVCKKHVKAHFDSMPKRIQKAIEANGGHTKY